MSGFFGIASRKDCLSDVFFGIDYHSHLGSRRAGIASYNEEIGLRRKIHSIENSPFRTKFEHIFEEMKATSAIGCISSVDPQPLLIRSNLGTYAISMIGAINNAEELMDQYLSFTGGHFGAMTNGGVNSVELVAAIINQKKSFVEGIEFAQSVIKGSVSILILKSDGSLIAARDSLGRLPVILGKNKNGYCVAFENFAYKKLGYDDLRELGPGEVVDKKRPLNRGKRAYSSYPSGKAIRLLPPYRLVRARGLHGARTEMQGMSAFRSLPSCAKGRQKIKGASHAKEAAHPSARDRGGEIR